MVFRFHKVINAPHPPFFLFYTIAISVQIASGAQVEMGSPFCFICSRANSAEPQLYIFHKSDISIEKPRQKRIYANTAERKTRHICGNIHVCLALTLNARKKPKWRTAIKINFSLCPASLKRPDMDLYTARPFADCTRWCLNCARPWHHGVRGVTSRESTRLARR